MLKNLWTLNTFLHANQMRQNSKFLQRLFPAIFLLNVIGAMLSKNVGCSYRFHSFTFYSQLSSRLTVFSLQKQESCGWRLIYANYYLQYNLIQKSNSPFSSKINRFDGTDTWHTINKAINVRTFQSQVKSNTSHGSFRSHPPRSNACRCIQIPSLIFSAYLQSFVSHWHPAKLLQLLMMGRKYFPYRVWKWYSVGFSYMSNTLSSR